MWESIIETKQDRIAIIAVNNADNVGHSG